jgi:cobalt/nickel transport system permease protein
MDVGFLSMTASSLDSATGLLSHFPPLHPYFALHIPDGYLDNVPLLLVTWVVSLGLIALCLAKVQRTYYEKAVPLMGVCAAFIFAAQMINFPIPGGTSGHLLGGTLAGALLGPWAGSLVMVAVFIVQALLFQDGGITVLGVNIFNMGLIGTFGGYYLFRVVRNTIGRNKLSGLTVGGAVAAWVSVVVAAVVCALQLAIAGKVPLLVALVAMVGWHVVIGLGEALITVTTLTFIWRTRPELLYRPPRRAMATRAQFPVTR